VNESLTSTNCATVERWLTECSDLFVNVYLPHSGGSGTDYFIETLSDLRQLYDTAPPGAIIVILRERQFPFRGIIDDRLSAEVLQQFHEGQYWMIAGASRFPESISTFGGGDTRDAFERDLGECCGMYARIGREPSYPTNWTQYVSSDDWIFIEKPRNA